MRAAISTQGSAAHLFTRVAAASAAFIAICILSAAAFAQSCSPAEPRSDSGAGFTPFGAREQALGRGGHRGRAWEWAIGTDTRTGQKVQASLDWVSGRVYSWKLVNSGAGSAVLEIRDAERLRLRLAYPSGMDTGNALELRVLTHPSVGAKTSIEASLTSLNGHSVSGSLSQPGTRARSEQALYYYFPQMAQGFTAEGTVSLTYPPKPPSGSRVQFTVRAGTIACSSAGNAPTVSITDPASSDAFTAPATVTVTADAKDSDGTVAKVAFFANGNPVGTATASPFTIQWANVQAGAYSLTAVATDNEGLQTTSVAVPITVNAVKALYFIHVDHLNTPRLIADSTQKTVWRWDQDEPFGTNPANEDPDGDGIAFSFPQRFPGQYYDAEKLLHYNYFRDYDAGIGRYVQSDPIGLDGGLNTYFYVLSSPLSRTDARGLFSPAMHYGMTYQAMVAEGYSSRAAHEMAQRVVDVDNSISGQMPWNAVQHAMCPPLVKESECIRRINRFIEDQIYRCSPDSMPPGLHAVQDSGAGGHTGGQTYYGIPPPSHFMADFFPSMREMDEAIARSRQYIRRQKEICSICRP